MFRMFNPYFWKDPKIEEFNHLTKYLYIYLITNNHAGWSGCYEITLKKIIYETDFPSEKKLQESLKDLTDNNLIQYDTQTNEIILYNWYKSNWTTSPKIDMVIYKDILKIKSPIFKEYVYSLFKQRDSVKNNLDRYPIDTLSIPYRYPNIILSNIDINNNNNINNNLEEDNNIDSNNIYIERFGIFWKAYPRKEAKGKCLEWFKKTKPSKELLDDILKAIKKQKQSSKWQSENGRFIPMPFTWLNQKRWLDELDTTISNEQIDEDDHDLDYLLQELQGD